MLLNQIFYIFQKKPDWSKSKPGEAKVKEEVQEVEAEA